MIGADEVFDVVEDDVQQHTFVYWYEAAIKALALRLARQPTNDRTCSHMCCGVLRPLTPFTLQCNGKLGKRIVLIPASDQRYAVLTAHVHSRRLVLTDGAIDRHTQPTPPASTTLDRQRTQQPP